MSDVITVRFETTIDQIASEFVSNNDDEIVEKLIVALDAHLGDQDVTERLLQNFVKIVAKGRQELGEDFDINEFAPPTPAPTKPKKRKSHQGEMFP